MNFKSVNKIYQEAFKKNWDRPAISNYQGVTLHYRDVDGKNREDAHHVQRVRAAER